MNEQGIRWDDLQIVLAIADTGSLSGAGRRLDLSHATVFRRLTEMERRLGVRLFERARSGYTPTLLGSDLAASAGRIEAEVLGAERRVAGRDLKLTGSIRVTTTDTLFAGLLAPLFAQFQQKYPDIELEVVISNQVHSLAKREADVAIRPTLAPPETLIGRQLIDIPQAVYGQHDQWREARPPLPLAALAEHEWVGPDRHLGDTALERWMAEDGRSERCRFRVDSMLGMQRAVREAAGVAVLPCYLGDGDPGLRRLTLPIPELTTQLWLLTHPDLRRMTRIRTFMDEIGEGVKRRS